MVGTLLRIWMLVAATGYRRSQAFAGSNRARGYIPPGITGSVINAGLLDMFSDI